MVEGVVDGFNRAVTYAERKLIPNAVFFRVENSEAGRGNSYFGFSSTKIFQTDKKGNKRMTGVDEDFLRGGCKKRV